MAKRTWREANTESEGRRSQRPSEWRKSKPVSVCEWKVQRGVLSMSCERRLRIVI